VPVLDEGGRWRSVAGGTAAQRSESPIFGSALMIASKIENMFALTNFANCGPKCGPGAKMQRVGVSKTDHNLLFWLAPLPGYVSNHVPGAETRVPVRY